MVKILQHSLTVLINTSFAAVQLAVSVDESMNANHGERNTYLVIASDLIEWPLDALQGTS